MASIGYYYTAASDRGQVDGEDQLLVNSVYEKNFSRALGSPIPLTERAPIR